MSAKKVNYLEFLKTVGKSKRLLRSGWIREKIEDPESVAEHSFRVGILAMILSDKLGYKFDKEKLMKMALLHDIGEVITGDIVTERWDIIDIKKRQEKEKLEREGIKKIFSSLSDDANQYMEIYDEMIGKTTPEAKAFVQFDKLEMALQALEYEEEQGKNLEEFFMNVELYYVKDPLIRVIFEEIKKARPKKERKK